MLSGLLSRSCSALCAQFLAPCALLGVRAAHTHARHAARSQAKDFAPRMACLSSSSSVTGTRGVVRLEGPDILRFLQVHTVGFLKLAASFRYFSLLRQLVIFVPTTGPRHKRRVWLGAAGSTPNLCMHLELSRPVLA
jgi:hypothetical protein